MISYRITSFLSTTYTIDVIFLARHFSSIADRCCVHVVGVRQSAPPPVLHHSHQSHEHTHTPQGSLNYGHMHTTHSRTLEIVIIIIYRQTFRVEPNGARACEYIIIIDVLLHYNILCTVTEMTRVANGGVCCTCYYTSPVLTRL